MAFRWRSSWARRSSAGYTCDRKSPLGVQEEAATGGHERQAAFKRKTDEFQQVMVTAQERWADS
jgi:hypothetical protein